MVYQCLDCTEPEQSAYCRMLCDGQHPPQRSPVGLNAGRKVQDATNIRRHS